MAQITFAPRVKSLMDVQIDPNQLLGIMSGPVKPRLTNAQMTPQDQEMFYGNVIQNLQKQAAISPMLSDILPQGVKPLSFQPSKPVMSGIAPPIEPPAEEEPEPRDTIIDGPESPGHREWRQRQEDRRRREAWRQRQKAEQDAQQFEDWKPSPNEDLPPIKINEIGPDVIDTQPDEVLVDNPGRGWTLVPNPAKNIPQSTPMFPVTGGGGPELRPVGGGVLKSEPTNPEMPQKAKDYFGVTKNPAESGYLMHDGTYLDMTGRHHATGYKEGKPLPGQPDYLKNQRSVDHREIGDLVPSGGSEGMIDFMTQSGAIRVDDPTGLFEMYGRPTDAQIRKIRDSVSRHNGAVSLDLYRNPKKYDKKEDRYVYDDKDRFANVYPIGTPVIKIMTDINRFFNSSSAPIYKKESPMWSQGLGEYVTPKEVAPDSTTDYNVVEGGLDKGTDYEVGEMETIYRGEGGSSEFQGSSAFVKGKNFAFDKGRASEFGNVTEYELSPDAKIIKINTVGKELSQIAKELGVSETDILSPTRLQRALLKLGYDGLEEIGRIPSKGNKQVKDLIIWNEKVIQPKGK